MMTDFSLNTWKFQAQTWGDHVVYRNCFWHSEQFSYTTCSPYVLQKEELLTKIYLYCGPFFPFTWTWGLLQGSTTWNKFDMCTSKEQYFRIPIKISFGRTLLGNLNSLCVLSSTDNIFRHFSLAREAWFLGVKKIKTRCLWGKKKSYCR